MSLFLVDIATEALQRAEDALKEVQGVGEVHSMVVDVSKVKEVIAFRDKVLDIFGEVSRHSATPIVSSPSDADYGH